MSFLDSNGVARLWNHIIAKMGSLLTGYAKVEDIPSRISDLTTDSTHRTVTDTEKANWNAKSNFSGNYDDLVNKPTIPSTDTLATKVYVDNKISAIPTPDVSGQINAHNVFVEAHSDIRDLITGLTNRLNALADSDDTTLDQLSEIVTYIKSNKNLIDSITTNKVNVDDIINDLVTNVSNKPLSAAQGVVLKGLIDALDSNVIKKNNVATEVTETEVNPVSGAAVYDYVAENTNNIKNLVDGEGSDALKSINSTNANGDKAVALGNRSKSEGRGSFSANYGTEAFGHNSAAFGYQNKATRDYEFVLGQYNDYQLEYVENVTNSSGTSNVNNGIYKLSSEPTIIDEGYRVYYQINGDYTESTIAELQNGDIYIYTYQNITNLNSYEICTSDPTDGSYEGYEYKAYSSTSHKIQITNNRILTVGNGTYDENRSNAMTLDWDGNAWFSGGVYIGSSNNKLATENYAVAKTGDTMTGKLSIDYGFYPTLRISCGDTWTNSKGTYSSLGFECDYSDMAQLWVYSDKTTDNHSRRGISIKGWGQTSNPAEALAFRQCDTNGNWLSDLKMYHEGNIIYSETEPENPVEGMIWLVPPSSDS